MNNIIGVIDLVPNNNYTLDFGNLTTFVNKSLRSFGLLIQEIVEQSVDTFQFDNNSVQSLKVNNIQNDSALELFNQTSNNKWRMRTNGDNLVFEKWNGVSWVIKGTIFN